MLEVGFLYRLRNNAVEGEVNDYRLAGGCVIFHSPLPISVADIAVMVVTSRCRRVI